MKPDEEYFAKRGSPFQRICQFLRIGKSTGPPDWVLTPHNKSWALAPDFQAGYSRAVRAIGLDYRIPWRVHQAIWAANHCLTIPGDFVELGTGQGFVMQSVLGSLKEWAKCDKTLYLYDTFQKFAVSGKGKAIHDAYYAKDLDSVKRNFAEDEAVEFVQGDVAETIKGWTDPIAFLHVDLNDAKTELIALSHLFDYISVGGIILLDDFGNLGEEKAFDTQTVFFNSRGHKVLSTPSGQGIVIKK